MIINPRDYYRGLAGRGSLLADLAAQRHADQPDPDDPAGPGAGRRLRRGGPAAGLARSVIRVAAAAAGTFAGPGLAVCGEVYEGLAVHLPTNLFLAVPAGRAAGPRGLRGSTECRPSAGH